MDPNFAGFQQEAPETQKVKRSRSGSRQTHSPENAENMEVATDSTSEVKADENPAPMDVNRSMIMYSVFIQIHLLHTFKLF